MSLQSVSQNKITLPIHPQSQNVASQSKVSWAKVAKGIALLGGLVAAGYSLYLLTGRLSAPPPPTPTPPSPQSVCNSIKFFTGKTCCAGDLNCKDSGKGIFQSVKGDFYEGDFVNGVRTGKGIYTWPDGSSCEGDFVNSARTGKGIYTWPNGERYEGDFMDGDRTGKGIYTWPNGERYEGEFMNGVFSGQGTYTSSDGTSCKGDFVYGVFSGQGLKTSVEDSLCDLAAPLAKKGHISAMRILERYWTNGSCAYLNNDSIKNAYIQARAGQQTTPLQTSSSLSSLYLSPCINIDSLCDLAEPLAKKGDNNIMTLLETYWALCSCSHMDKNSIRAAFVSVLPKSP